MGPPARRAYLRLSLVVFLAAVLVLLAVLQYRWSLEISGAERTRMEAALNASVAQFRQEFYRELSQVSAAFHADPAAEPADLWSTYAGRYQAWMRSASRPDLIADVYILQAGAPEESNLRKLNPAGDRFENVDWPASLAGLRPRLEEEALREREPGGPPAPELRAFAWTLEQRVPALVRAIFNFPRPRLATEPRMILGFLIVQLNRGVIDRLLGELAQRYFAGPQGFVYNVAVVSGGSGGGIVYRSDPQLTEASFGHPDAHAALLPFAEVPPREPGMRFHRGRQRLRAAIILPSTAEEPWVLLARHREGSLESVVAADQRRNLLLSFGVLLVLAFSMALVMVSAQRARRLARLQMEFVAGVSHELRTPVAVICSAADNLAEGFIDPKEQVKEYGSLIRSEGRRLAAMIEQILHFAAGQSRQSAYDLKPVSVADAVAAVLADVSTLPEGGGYTVERALDPDLPLVEADASALARCLENLVLNAFKYGGKSRWVRIAAVSAGSRVRISVEDRGSGIDPADLPHIFEPFYRGKAAQAAQIHGTGLGLSLARDIAEAMGGRLEVSSQPGQGATFTLDLPAAAAQPVTETV